MSTTVQTIINSAQRDAVNRIGTSHPALIDWCNRVQLDLLRASRWTFALSADQIFTTQYGVTDYWIGAKGTGPGTAYDTGLNLADVRYIANGTVYDRSNFLPLQPVPEPPVSAKLFYPDSSSRPGRPKVWKQDPTTPYILSLYPAADNQNSFQPQPTGIVWSTTAGGSQPARVYYVTVSYVDQNNGESTVPWSAKVYVPANQVLVVNQPIEPEIKSSTGIAYDRYKVYAATARGSECLQSGGTPVSVSTWTEPISGLVTGTATPLTSSTVEAVDGYVMAFRYFKTRPQLAAVSDVLTIPDDYIDVVVAGVNYLLNNYLDDKPGAQQWYALYQRGVAQIIRDANWHQRVAGYISPDATSVGQFLPAVESIDLSILIN